MSECDCGGVCAGCAAPVCIEWIVEHEAYCELCDMRICKECVPLHEDHNL